MSDSPPNSSFAALNSVQGHTGSLVLSPTGDVLHAQGDLKAADLGKPLTAILQEAQQLLTVQNDGASEGEDLESLS
ncbi:hypothetical protein H4R35_007455, partial [Dimargaris xerosporica]